MIKVLDYDAQEAENGCYVDKHPLEIMKEVCKKNDFKLIAGWPCLFSNYWLFWVETEDKKLYLPPYIKEVEYMEIKKNVL